MIGQILREKNAYAQLADDAPALAAPSADAPQNAPQQGRRSQACQTPQAALQGGKQLMANEAEAGGEVEGELAPGNGGQCGPEAAGGREGVCIRQERFQVRNVQGFDGLCQAG